MFWLTCEKKSLSELRRCFLNGVYDQAASFLCEIRSSVHPSLYSSMLHAQLWEANKHLSILVLGSSHLSHSPESYPDSGREVRTRNVVGVGFIARNSSNCDNSKSVNRESREFWLPLSAVDPTLYFAYASSSSLHISSLCRILSLSCILDRQRSRESLD